MKIERWIPDEDEQQGFHTFPVLGVSWGPMGTTLFFGWGRWMFNLYLKKRWEESGQMKIDELEDGQLVKHVLDGRWIVILQVAEPIHREPSFSGRYVDGNGVYHVQIFYPEEVVPI